MESGAENLVLCQGVGVGSGRIAVETGAEVSPVTITTPKTTLRCCVCHKFIAPFTQKRKGRTEERSPLVINAQNSNMS